jgi:hypothetical protein
MKEEVTKKMAEGTEGTEEYNAEVMEIAGVTFKGVRTYSLVLLLVVALLVSISMGKMDATLTLLASNVVMFYLGMKSQQFVK